MRGAATLRRVETGGSLTSANTLVEARVASESDGESEGGGAGMAVIVKRLRFQDTVEVLQTL